MTTQVHNEKLSPWPWQVSQQHVSFDPVGMDKKLKDLSQACYVVNDTQQGLGVAQQAQVVTDAITAANALPVSAFAPALGTQSLGDSNFRRVHGWRYL
ncbi:MAG TPA: 2-nitropropane dioxygenase, partial [Shewanella frigidimarina]|nr:2-nitropropane dioxygenase [Shewanella frigidimarina]